MADEREDLHALVHSPGWQQVVTMARIRWGGEGYGREIKLAIQTALGKHTSVEAAVQAVDAASDAVNQVLSWPEEQLRRLERQHEQGAALDPRGIYAQRRGGV